MKPLFAVSVIIIFSVLLTSGSRVARAGVTDFEIQRSQSELDLTVDATVFGGVGTITEQFPDSETFYLGDMAIDHTSNSVNFVGGSNAEADNLREQVFFLSLERNVSPGVGGVGSASPANYGIKTSVATTVSVPDIPIGGGITLSLGSIQSVDIDVAIRELSLDLTSSGPLAIDASGNTFDASQVEVSIVEGFADIQGAVVFKQSNVATWGAATLALQALASQASFLNITVNSDIFSLTNSIGFGTRVGISSSATLTNTSTLDGIADGFDAAGDATLTTPLEFSVAPDFGVASAVLDFEFGFSGTLVSEGEMFLAGDFDDDLDVDGFDFLEWQRDGPPSGLTDWEANYGSGVGGSGLAASTSSVPEPSTALLLCLGVGVCLHFRWLR